MTEHRHEVLPWYINGTLSAEERIEVKLHLEQCAQCHAEYEWLIDLQAKMQSLPMEFDAEAAWEKVKQKTRESDKAGNVVGFPRRFDRWMKPALAIAATLLVIQAGVIGMLLQRAPGVITTLSGSAEGRGVLQIVFKPDTTELELRQALGSVQGQIIAGPGALGIYEVRVAPQGVDQAIIQLQHNPHVESINRVGS